jgi:hypothetical protein
MKRDFYFFPMAKVEVKNVEQNEDEQTSKANDEVKKVEQNEEVKKLN